jgi:hypothetical protein
MNEDQEPLLQEDLTEYLTDKFGGIRRVRITGNRNTVVDFDRESRLMGCLLEAYLERQKSWPCSRF